MWVIHQRSLRQLHQTLDPGCFVEHFPFFTKDMRVKAPAAKDWANGQDEHGSDQAGIDGGYRFFLRHEEKRTRDDNQA
jgi:hypothetical protein